MEAVLRVSRSLAGEFDLPRVLGGALTVVADLVGAEGASILLIDPETQRMNFYIAEGPGSQKAKTVALPPGAGICGHVARTGKPLIVNDAQNDPRLYHAVDEASGIVTHNILCVPVRSGERLWGVLELINKLEREPFDPQDLRLSEVIAAEIGLALENSNLHAEIVRSERMAAVGQTVSGLAHCIKNILNGIRAGSTVVDGAMKTDDFEQVRKGWENVRRNNTMLSNLVLDMLALARQSEPHPFATDVNDLAEQVCALMTDRAAEKQVAMSFTPAENLDEVVLDPTHFYRCLLNLVSNAVDACSSGDRVAVRLARSDRRARFTTTVADTGAGMDKATKAKLFQEFFTTKGPQGTGLGLAVTKKLIDQLHGDIRCHSVAGHGTRFVLSLPVDDETHNKHQEKSK